MDIVKITIEEFKQDIYNRYINLFPEDEQREWKNIINTYKLGIEKFYKIVDNNKTIGFFLLEKIDNHPYYLDYFAIFEEYQGMGYGSKSLKKLIEILDDGLIGEIEEVVDDNTTRRLKFYKELGFKTIDSLYLLYGVNYIPIVINYDTNKKLIDNIFKDYYILNCGKEEFKNNCKFIK